MRSGRIAVVRAGALGDVLLGLPALQALRARYPAAAIHLVAPMPQAKLALAAGAVDAAVDVDDPEMGVLFAAPAGVRRAPAWLQDLDLAVVWLRRPDAVAEQLRRLGAAQVVAAPPYPPPLARRHVADWLFETLAPVGVRPTAGWGAASWFRADLPARRWAAEWVRERFGAAPHVVVHPGSGSGRKNWPAGSWAQVITALRAGHEIGVVVVAGPADERALAAFYEAARAALRERSAVLANTDLPRLAAVLATAALYLGNDSGVSHLAAAGGAPTVAVFGPTDPATWRPRGPRVRVLGGAAPDRGAAHPATIIAGAAAWPEVQEVVAAAEVLLGTALAPDPTRKAGRSAYP